MANMLPGVDPKFHFFSLLPAMQNGGHFPRFAAKTEKQTRNENVSRSRDGVDKWLIYESCMAKLKLVSKS